MHKMHWPDQRNCHQTSHNVKIICALYCFPLVWTYNERKSKSIPETDPHFRRVQCNPNMCFGVGNKNHDYKEKILEILWGPNTAMSN